MLTQHLKILATHLYSWFDDHLNEFGIIGTIASIGIPSINHITELERMLGSGLGCILTLIVIIEKIKNRKNERRSNP